MKVKRYGWGSEDFGETPSGEYVSASDYAILEADFKTAESLLRKAIERCACQEDYPQRCDECLQAEAFLNKDNET